MTDHHATDEDGRTLRLTVITPVKPGRTPLQRIVFEVLPRTPWGKSNELLDLSFIQSARWSLITGLPRNGREQRPERLRYDYLLFESNYNGSLDAYIEAFSNVIPDRMKRVWATSFGFPGPIPVSPFLAFINKNDFHSDYFYSAYPDAANTEVLTALTTRALVDELAAVAGSLPAETFRERYADMLVAAQRRPEPQVAARSPRGNVCGKKYALTTLTPLPPEAVKPLQQHLRSMQGQGTGPFDRVPGLHFAKWVVIPDVVYEGPPQRRDSWANPYLLMTTTTDGVDDPLSTLWENAGPEADEIWSQCIGYPGRDDQAAFLRYFRRNQVRTNRFFCGYPDASVDDVLCSLRRRAELIDFAQAHQTEPNSERLQQHFRTAFSVDATAASVGAR